MPEQKASQFIANATKNYLRDKQINTLYSEPGSPWQNGYVESFHNRLQDECIKQEWFLSVAEARVVINQWRRKYNAQHPHSRLGFISPNAFAKLWQSTKQTVLGSARATPSLRQGLIQQPIT